MNRLRPRRSRLWLMAILTITLFIYTFNVSLSRYSASINANQDVIAVPILTLTNNNLNVSVDNMLPGDTREYQFEVNNEQDGKYNEVSLTYYFNLVSTTKVPLTLELYSVDGEEEKQIDLEQTATTNGEDTIKTYNTSKAPEQMNYGTTEISRHYKIKIKWDEKDNSYTYAGQPISIKVELKGTQA